MIKNSIIDLIANKDSCTAKVFQAYFCDWENSSTVSMKIYPSMNKSLYPEMSTKPIKKTQFNRSNIYSISQDLIKGGYLTMQTMRKQELNKYVGARPYYKANEKAFLEYFKDNYDFKPSPNALLFIQAILKYYRIPFIQGFSLSRGLIENILNQTGHFLEWKYNQNRNIFLNFVEFIKYILQHDLFIPALDTISANYRVIHQYLGLDEFNSISDDDGPLFDDLFDENKTIQIIKENLQSIKKPENIEELSKIFDKEPDFLTIVSPIGFILNCYPEIYSEIVLGLFNAFPDRKMFQIRLAYELNKPLNTKNPPPNLRMAYEKIKVEDALT